jgi:Sec-independent protein translocase protein TatA
LTILLVGYFVLGPSDLYKLVKEIGKFIQNVRTLGSEATKTFENSMESQLELKEIRKAQRELNDAFSFRRSINVDDQAEAFSTDTAGPVEDVVPPAATAATAAASDATTTAPVKPKKKRRRIKKKQPAPVAETAEVSGSIPDLDVNDAFPDTTKSEKSTEEDSDWFSDDKKERKPSAAEMAAEDRAWLDSTVDEDESPKRAPVMAPVDAAATSAEQSRFQQQLSASWNQKVMENEEQLAPLALIMERLAILEEERAAADRRLEEEFRARFKLEEDYYREKRQVLEEAAAKVQSEAYVTMDGSSKKQKSS